VILKMEILPGSRKTIMGEQPFSDKFPVLFNLCQVQDRTTKKCRDANYLIPFRRRLRGELLDHWNYVLNILHSAPFHDENDRIAWFLNKKCYFLQ
jgi:hypothetical protein